MRILTIGDDPKLIDYARWILTELRGSPAPRTEALSEILLSVKRPAGYSYPGFAAGEERVFEFHQALLFKIDKGS